MVQVLPYTVTHLTHHLTHPHNLTHSHQPAINTANPLYMFKHRPSTLMLHIFNLTYANPLPHHLHKIANPLTIICTNNKFIHRQHNHLIHIFHNHSTYPPPYFPQYPPTNSPSANSTDSSILLALQKQWERQERLDMECNEIERQKEERKRRKGTKKRGKKMSGKM